MRKEGVLQAEIELVVPFFDVDMMEVVWHGHYVKYFEEARCALLDKLGLSARQLLRTGEDEYKSLALANPELSEAELIEAMVEHPRLIERPILVAGDKAIVGRPPERVLEILP